MTKILVLNGPNLGKLGTRQPQIYGSATLGDVERALEERALQLGVQVSFLQSDDLRPLIEAVGATDADAIIINPASLTHHSFALRDALGGCGKPVYEVHISNIAAREPYRRRSLIAPIARGSIVGLGTHGYLLALEAAAREATT